MLWIYSYILYYVPLFLQVDIDSVDKAFMMFQETLEKEEEEKKTNKDKK